ncbi:dihydrolipoamide acetyltransferase, partial [Neisseria meningitidis]|nr:dihydrolipoamide acetyltransferase [Neisseria meningitidis]
MSIVEIKVPDIGGHENVDIIAVEVKVGDTIAVDDTLITLETDKATMDVPADAAGVVKEVKVKVGDKISEGGVILTVETGAAAAEAAPAAAEAQPAPAAAPVAAGGATVQVAVPDIGGHTDVDVIAVEIKVGDTVAEDDTLITLETDKATMDVPCTAAGVVKAVFLKVGDKVSEGTAIIEVETAGSAAAAPAQAAQAAAPAAAPPPTAAA